MKHFLVLIFLSVSLISVGCESDTLNFHAIQAKLESLKIKVDEVKRDQLNYSIEKELIRETFSNKYENINLILTVILGSVGLLAFFGIRDINSIRKEYREELNNLRAVKTEFDLEKEQYQESKVKFETELKEIIQKNEEQSNQIKIIELKEKIRKFIKDEDNYNALDYINAAIALAPDDPMLQNQKGLILIRLNRLSDAVKVFDMAVSSYPDNESIILDAAECYAIANEKVKFDKLIESNKTIFDNKSDGDVLRLLNLIFNYHAGEIVQMKEAIKHFLNDKDLGSKVSRISGWSILEALYFIDKKPESETKSVLREILWYLHGTINGETLKDRISI